MAHSTGNLRSDLTRELRLQEAVSPEDARRSPLVAGLLSAAVPGLGQAYAEGWTFNWRSAAYVAAEAALWTAVISYNSRGDAQTDEFQRYADAHWDVTEYVKWIDRYKADLNNADITGVITTNDPATPPWDRISWTALHTLEEQVGAKTGTGFTHRLPTRPEQQYYELIGKYAQYGGGWDDAVAWFTPTHLLADQLSPRFLEYSKMRGRANDLYSSATSASYLIVANHVISALEAAWSTSRANRRLEARAEMRGVDRGFGWTEAVPHLVVDYHL